MMFILILCFISPRAREYGSRPSSSESSTLGDKEKYAVREPDEEALTGQIMDSMDMMFAVMSNAAEGEVNEVKITLSKTANNELSMKVKSTQSDPIDFTLQRPATDDNTWMQHSIATLNQQIRNLEAEVTSLRTRVGRQVVAGYTISGLGQWSLAPDSGIFNHIVQTTVNLAHLNLPAPPTTVMAQLFEIRRGQAVGTSKTCAVSDITQNSFKVKVKHGRLRRAQRFSWHIYFMCAY